MHPPRLLTLPEFVQEVLRIGALKTGHGRLLLTCRDRARQLDLATRAIRGRLSMRATKRIARAGRAGAVEASVSPTPSQSPDVVRLEAWIPNQIGSPTTVDEAAGTLTIDYRRSLKVLEGLLERLSVKSN